MSIGLLKYTNELIIIEPIKRGGGGQGTAFDDSILMGLGIQGLTCWPVHNGAPGLLGRTYPIQPCCPKSGPRSDTTAQL